MEANLDMGLWGKMQGGVVILERGMGWAEDTT